MNFEELDEFVDDLPRLLAAVENRATSTSEPHHNPSNPTLPCPLEANRTDGLASSPKVPKISSTQLETPTRQRISKENEMMQQHMDATTFGEGHVHTDQFLQKPKSAISSPRSGLIPSEVKTVNLLKRKSLTMEPSSVVHRQIRHYPERNDVSASQFRTDVQQGKPMAKLPELGMNPFHQSPMIVLSKPPRALDAQQNYYPKEALSSSPYQSTNQLLPKDDIGNLDCLLWATTFAYGPKPFRVGLARWGEVVFGQCASPQEIDLLRYCVVSHMRTRKILDKVFGDIVRKNPAFLSSTKHIINGQSRYRELTLQSLRRNSFVAFSNLRNTAHQTYRLQIDGILKRLDPTSCPFPTSATDAQDAGPRSGTSRGNVATANRASPWLQEQDTSAPKEMSQEALRKANEELMKYSFNLR